MKALIIRLIISLLCWLIISQCAKEDTGLIAAEQEHAFGACLDSIILNDPTKYAVLDTGLYHDAYIFVDSMLTKILDSPEIQRPDAFEYTIRIVNHNALNYYVFPGGFMYINTGFIKYLDNGAQLAGVMAHQAAHIDRRHLTGIFEDMLGIDVLLGIITGTDSVNLNYLVDDLTGGFGEIVFTDNQEYEADEYAVKYTKTTNYDPMGIAYFIIKASQSIQSGIIPEFVNTHPISEIRLQKVNMVWESLESPEGELYINEYREFKQMIP